MLTLNLLPEHYKEEYAFEKKKRFVVFLGISVCIIVLVFDALLYSIYFFLEIHEQSLADVKRAQESAETAQRLSALKEEVRALNADIGAREKARREASPVAFAIEHIASLVSQGTYVKTLSLDGTMRIVQLAGFAPTREAVLALSAALSGSDFVEPGTLEDPVKNILRERDIEFTFTFALKSAPRETIP